MCFADNSTGACDINAVCLDDGGGIYTCDCQKGFKQKNGTCLQGKDKLTISEIYVPSKNPCFRSVASILVTSHGILIITILPDKKQIATIR